MLVGRSLVNFEEYTCGVPPTQRSNLYTSRGNRTWSELLEHIPGQSILLHFLPVLQAAFLCFCIQLCYLAYSNFKALEKYLLIVHLAQMIPVAL